MKGNFGQRGGRGIGKGWRSPRKGGGFGGYWGAYRRGVLEGAVGGWGSPGLCSLAKVTELEWLLPGAGEG